MTRRAQLKYLAERRASLDSLDRLQWTPLHAAAKNRHLRIAIYLAEQGANVDLVNRGDCIPLNYALSQSEAQDILLLVSAITLLSSSMDVIHSLNERRMWITLFS